MDHPVAAETFTIQEAADALGRSLSTLRRWIASDRIPEPYLRDVARGYRVYSVGELRTMAQIIARHERDFMYLVAENTHVIHELHQAIQAYRALHV